MGTHQFTSARLSIPVVDVFIQTTDFVLSTAHLFYQHCLGFPSQHHKCRFEVPAGFQFISTSHNLHRLIFQIFAPQDFYSINVAPQFSTVLLPVDLLPPWSTHLLFDSCRQLLALKLRRNWTLSWWLSFSKLRIKLERLAFYIEFYHKDLAFATASYYFNADLSI